MGKQFFRRLRFSLTAGVIRRLRFPLSGIKRRWLINSLAFSLALIFLGIAGYTVGLSMYYYNGLQSALENRSMATANYFSRYINTGYDDFYNSAARFARDFADNDKIEVQFVDTTGRVQVSTARQTVGFSPLTGDINDAIRFRRVAAWRGIDPLSDEHVLSVSAPLFFGGQEVIGVMRYVTSLSEANRRIVVALTTAVGIGLALIVFIVFMNLYFIGTIVTPIQEINRIAGRIAAGSFGVRIEKKYDDEIGELVDTINNMSAEIAGAERLKAEFISSVSHELRTPLTAITGWSEVLLATPASETAEIHKGVGIILKETTRLSKLVEELLDFTRMESSRMTMLMEPFELGAELEEVIYMYTESLGKEGIALNYTPPDDAITVVGDASRLRQVFLNLLDNAVKHGGGGKRIDAALYIRDGEAVAEIRDYGEGIAEDELPFVKRKFYRGKTKARGSGIGLAISEEIITMHDGRLELESVSGEGTVVRVLLPCQLTINN
ncbi:MAG: HAMP domain-containing histidine kinase [Oscillospiraceae bacterium]|nr:HAMP domain-containing histidine kinase [Oscillospiraceae bacterium]